MRSAVTSTLRLVTQSVQEGEPWFSGREGTVLLYRINRRPLAQLTLWSEQPESVLDHVVEVLRFGDEVVTGRRHQRTWRLGNRNIDDRRGVLTGQVGWQATGTEAADRYDDQRLEWVDVVGERGRTARAPFAFDADTRVLGVLRHPSFGETVLPKVFTTLLNRGESDRSARSTDWEVEPIGDPSSFREWLRSTDVVERVQLVAKLPNPEGLEDFGQVWQRMEAHKAKVIREIMEAANPTVGLVDLERDDVVAAYLAMGERAFGYVTATGVRDGRSTRFDQRAKVARRQTRQLPSSWSEVLAVLVDFVKERWTHRDS